jgi:hypothetical protein
VTRRIVALGVVELTLIGTLGWLPAGHRFPWPGLLLFAAAFATYAIAGVLVYRGRAESQRNEPGPGPSRAIWMVAVAMRLALLPLAPELSDDFHRYVWDGHVQASGTNPYLYAPAADEVEPIRTETHHLINNPTVPTIYPPLAQLAFLLIALAGSNLVVMKLLWLAADLGTAWVLTRIARETGRDPALVLLLYAWAPLLVVEVAWNAHLEPLGMLPMAGAIWAAVRLGRGARASAEAGPDESGHRHRTTAAVLTGALLAASALVKFAPAAALPALAPRGRRLLPDASAANAIAVTAFGLTIALVYAPYAAAGPALFTGLRTYSEHWWFMKGAFGLIEWVVGDPLTARRAVGTLVVGVVALTWFRRFDLERSLLWILGTGMVLTPTLHPWYVLWMLPMAALRRSPPWLALSGLTFIGYFGLGAYQESGEWLQPAAARAALWLPFFGLLARETVQSIRGDAPT